VSGRFEPYDLYQDSELDWLGEVPSHWELRRLGGFFNERREKVSDKDFPPLSVTMQGIVPQLEDAAKTKDGDNRKLVRRGDFVINSRSDRKGSSGVSPLDGSVSLIAIVLEPDGLMPEYVHHLLRSEAFQEEFYRYGKGIVADLWSTNYSAMKNITIPVLPSGEQKQIASFLDYETAKIDALIEKQQQLIALLGEKRQAVRDSGVEWVGDIPEHWKTPPVYARYDAVLGKMYDENKLTGLHPIVYLRNADVNWDSINVESLPIFDIAPHEFERFTVKNGDLLICEGGAGIGQTAIWQGELERCAFQKALHRLRPLDTDTENPRFFYYCMRFVIETEWVLAGGTATIPHLTGEQLRKYRFPCPPKNEQDEIVSHLDALSVRFDRIESHAADGMELLQERRTALISAAVTGKIDVRGWKPPASDVELETEMEVA